MFPYDDFFIKSHLQSRLHFGGFLNDLELNGTAVEVGVHRGVFAQYFLGQWHGKYYCGIDPWRTLAEYADQEKTLPNEDTGELGSSDRTADLLRTLRALKDYEDRIMLMRTTSARAVTHFADESVDFVYLDGDHKQAAFLADLRCWWPKIVRNGFIAGHDVAWPLYPDFEWAAPIQAALREFFGPLGLQVNVIEDMEHLPWSWYVRKPT